MRGVVDIDGELVPADQARVSVFDRGFLYGDSAFEAMRTYGGTVFRREDHLARLLQSCERLRIRLPIEMATLEARIDAAVAAHAAQAAQAASGEADCYLRVMVTRGVGPMGLDLRKATRPSVLIFALELTLPDPAIYERGIVLGLVHTGRSTDGTGATGAKHSNYLASVLALEEVRARGADDALLLGAHGEVAEGATSNVFLASGGALATPPLSAGILEGITRRVVFEIAAELGIPCSERHLVPTDLYGADEVFVTSSVRELVPVVRVDDVQVADGRPGPLFSRIRAAYRARTQASGDSA